MDQPAFKFSNGDEVKDKITGFKGIIVAQTRWLNGCIRYLIQPQTLRDGKTIEGESIDEGQLDLIKAVKPVKKEAGKKDIGGPFPSPTLPRHPR
jgi:hypothetical protein